MLLQRTHGTFTNLITKMKYMKRLSIILLSLLSGAIPFSSCNKTVLPKSDDKKPKVYKGAQVDLGEGKATGWISVSRSGEPVELGVELTRKSLYNLPDADFHVAVPLPDRTKELTPFDHVYITWSSHGHRGPNDTSFISSHYDVSFFTTTLEEQLAIPAPTDPSAKYNVYPPTGYMPADYYPFGNLKGVGATWTDKVGYPGIRKAMVLGSYNGKFTFVSPIVIIEELQSGNSSSTPYSQPQYFEKTNTYYPTTYNIYADNSEQKHQVTLSDFVRR